MRPSHVSQCQHSCLVYTANEGPVLPVTALNFLFRAVCFMFAGICYAYTRLGTVCAITFTESWYSFPLVPVLRPRVSVVGTPIAGQRYSLNCNITDIRSALKSSFTAQWIERDGRPVTSTYSSIRETTTNTDRSTIHTITFSPLRTSHGRQYTCRGSATTPLLLRTTFHHITWNVLVASKGYHRIL